MIAKAIENYHADVARKAASSRVRCRVNVDEDSDFLETIEAPYGQLRVLVDRVVYVRVLLGLVVLRPLVFVSLARLIMKLPI